MNTARLLVGIAAVGLLGAVGVTSGSAVLEDQHHFSPPFAKVTLANGAVHKVKFKGVGCAVALCSRVAIKSTEGPTSLSQTSTWLDSVAAIQDTTPHDALFVFKDGTQRRVAVVQGNRFLYLADGKVELSKLKSVEFLAK